jgi:hypothetical protein
MVLVRLRSRIFQKSSCGKLKTRRMEVAAGLEPAKTGFADQRLDRFGIATKASKTCATGTGFICKSCTQNAP